MKCGECAPNKKQPDHICLYNWLIFLSECALLLLAHNAPVKIKNAQGWSPLAEAISYGDRQMSKQSVLWIAACCRGVFIVGCICGNLSGIPAIVYLQWNFGWLLPVRWLYRFAMALSLFVGLHFLEFLLSHGVTNHFVWSQLNHSQVADNITRWH